MMIRLLLIASYIVMCITLRVGPWRYFQLNARYFNESKGIFSKLDIDRLIPDAWRLPQRTDQGNFEPESYPVFVKPEWGQNSCGIQRADCLESLQNIRQQRLLSKKPSKMQYLVQSAALGEIEFEIFMMPCHQNSDHYSVLSITQVGNSSVEKYPINGVNNHATHYTDLSASLSEQQKQGLWQQLKTLGDFRISRVGVRADSLSRLLSGDFKVIEINLFVPMPLILLSCNRSTNEKITFVFKTMYQLAKLTKSIPQNQAYKSIFFKKYYLSRQVKNLGNNETS